MNTSIKLKMILIAMTTLTLFSCKEDEPTVVGNWTAETIRYFGCDDPTFNETLIFGEDGFCEDDTDLNLFCIKTSMELREDGIFILYENVYLNGNLIAGESGTTTGTYTTTKPNNMTLNMGGEIQIGFYQISETELIFDGVSEDEDGCQFGFAANRQL